MVGYFHVSTFNHFQQSITAMAYNGEWRVNYTGRRGE